MSFEFFFGGVLWFLGKKVTILRFFADLGMIGPCVICLRRMGEQFYGDISWVDDDISVPSLVFMKNKVFRLICDFGDYI